MQRVHIEYMGDYVELPLGETLVGRDVSCALRFNDPAVSRRHLRFIRRQDEVFVEDLHSSNGTLLNGRALSLPLRIGDGDEIRVGARLLKVRIEEGDFPDQPSTLVLRSFNAGNNEVTYRRTTTEMAVPQEAATSHQRCPRCAASVSELDDQCAACGYHWGSFRPMARTDVRDNPLPPLPPDKNPPQPIDRRRHDRQPIELQLVYASDELEIEATSRDLSESGVFVCSQVLDPVGTHCQLTILVDGGPAIVCAGVVRRVVDRESATDSIGLGVEFVGIGEAQLGWIRATLARSQEQAEDDNTRPISIPD